MNLTPKQEMFCHEYLVDLNATQAAIRAGYSAKTAGSVGFENLKKPQIAERIQILKADRMERVGIDADYVLRRLHEISEFDLRELYDDEGNLKPVSEWSDVAGRVITSAEVNLLKSMGDDEEALQIWTKKIRMESKNKALELLGRHVSVRAFDNTVTLDVPPKVVRNFMGRGK